MWPRQPAQLDDRGLRSVSVNKRIWVILAEVVGGLRGHQTLAVMLNPDTEVKK